MELEVKKKGGLREDSVEKQPVENFALPRGIDDRDDTSELRLNSPTPMSNFDEPDIDDTVIQKQTIKKQQQSTRTSIMHFGEAYNKRKIEREALRQAVEDYHGSVPLQFWYDSLRDTDDGRFSKVDMQTNRNSRLNQRRNLQRKAQMMTTKLNGSQGYLLTNEDMVTAMSDYGSPTSAFRNPT